MEPERDCNHESRQLRWRKIESGLNTYRMFVYQCQACGVASTPIAAKSLTYGQKHGAETTEFDAGLRQRWIEEQNAKRQLEIDERQAERERSWVERQEFYHDYINSSPEWKERARLCIKLAPGGVCQGCGKRPPTQAHHLTYKHLGAEFLWELKAVCRDCHKRVHGIEG